MICPACSRNNAGARRYCGCCGCNFAPGCAGCGFANTQEDRFCGGCGAPLRLASTTGAAVLAPTTAPASAASPTPWAAEELAALFKPVMPERPGLPDAGISQDDVDRLFGGAA